MDRNIIIGICVVLIAFYLVSIYFAYYTYVEFKNLVMPSSSSNGGGTRYQSLAQNDEETAPRHRAFEGKGTRLGSDLEKNNSKLNRSGNG